LVLSLYTLPEDLGATAINTIRELTANPGNPACFRRQSGDLNLSPEHWPLAMALVSGGSIWGVWFNSSVRDGLHIDIAVQERIRSAIRNSFYPREDGVFIEETESAGQHKSAVPAIRPAEHKPNTKGDTMRRRCYILGAGFSKACGLPLASELTAKVLKYRDDPDAKLGLQDFDPQGTIQQERDLLRDLFPLSDLAKSWPDFEELITVLDEWNSYRTGLHGEDDKFVRSFRDSLLHALYGLLCEQVNTARKENALSTVQSFVQRAHSEQSTIVCFNWDLLVEVAAQDIGIGLAYRKEKEPIKDTIYMAKPHGSLNLAELTEQKYEESKHAINVAPHDMKVERRDEQTKTLVLRIQNPANNPKGVVYTFGPIVIPPTARKTYQSPWINYQWHFALDMVRNADEIVIIGYSLPPTDIRPRLLLQFANFRRGKRILIRLVDPKREDLRAHFEPVVGSPLEVISQPWESVVSSL
jgi:hypothetical protein